MIGDFISLFESGGVVMFPLVGLSIVQFYVISTVFVMLLGRSGALGSSDFCSGSTIGVDDFDKWLSSFNRHLRYARVLVSVPPLLGLLGTVGGIMKTFTALENGKRGAVDHTANGISEALVTTEFGLLIAIVGLVLLWGVSGFKRRILLRYERSQAASILIRTDSIC